MVALTFPHALGILENMKSSYFILIFLSFNIISCISSPLREPQSNESFHLDRLVYETKVPLVGNVELRTGVFFESSNVPFKGCVIYLEGLADSILNHRPLFSSLSENGFRVIAFDYMGQGGSSGSMNHTRLYEPLFPTLEIGSQARFVWQELQGLKSPTGHSCQQSKKMVIGWSTGGLAAYRLAYEKWADAVVLIAPGIHPRKFVGESAQSPSIMLTGDQVITQRTLTRNEFQNQANPHIDPINPISPMKVPFFASNLLITSELSHFWEISSTVKGLVFLSGEEDTYVDRDATKSTLAKRAPHFSIVAYKGALHEIDNELPDVSNDMVQKSIQFLSR